MGKAKPVEPALKIALCILKSQTQIKKCENFLKNFLNYGFCFGFCSIDVTYPNERLNAEVCNEIKKFFNYLENLQNYESSSSYFQKSNFPVQKQDNELFFQKLKLFYPYRDALKESKQLGLFYNYNESEFVIPSRFKSNQSLEMTI